MVGMDILFRGIRIWFVSLGKFPLRFISYDISMVFKRGYGILIGLEVTRIKDVSLGYDSSAGQRAEDKFVSPSAEMITFELGNGTVMTLRGSGTEPKLKYYIEAKGRSIEEAEEKARDVEKALTLMLEEVTS